MLLAATGRPREPIGASGHESPMADDQISRPGLKRDLKHEVQRLLPHIDHVNKDELVELDQILDRLEAVHISDHGCKILCTNSGRPHVPWGTRYAPWWERIRLRYFSSGDRS